MDSELRARQFRQFFILVALKIRPFAVLIVPSSKKFHDLFQKKFRCIYLDYEKCLFRLVRHARRERKPREKMAAWNLGARRSRKDFTRPFFFLTGFRVTHDALSERGTSCSLHLLMAQHTEEWIWVKTIFPFRNTVDRLDTRNIDSVFGRINHRRDSPAAVLKSTLLSRGRRKLSYINYQLHMFCK